MQRARAARVTSTAFLQAMLIPRCHRLIHILETIMQPFHQRHHRHNHSDNHQQKSTVLIKSDRNQPREQSLALPPPASAHFPT